MENPGLDINFMQGARDILNANQMRVNNEAKAREAQLLAEKANFEQGMALRKDARDEEVAGVTVAKNRQEMNAQAIDKIGAALFPVMGLPADSPERKQAVEYARSIGKLVGLDLPGDPTDKDIEQLVAASKDARDARKDSQQTVQVPIDNAGNVKTLQADPTGAFTRELGTGKKAPPSGAGPVKLQQTTFMSEDNEPILFNPVTSEYSVPSGKAFTKFNPKTVNPTSEERGKEGQIATLRELNTRIAEFKDRNKYVGLWDASTGKVSSLTDEAETRFRTLTGLMNEELIRMKSGAAITESEYARLQGMLPSLTVGTTEKAFQGKIDAFNEYLDIVMKSKKNAEAAGGVVNRDPAAEAQNVGTPAKKPKFKVISVK